MGQHETHVEQPRQQLDTISPYRFVCYFSCSCDERAASFDATVDEARDKARERARQHRLDVAPQLPAAIVARLLKPGPADMQITNRRRSTRRVRHGR